MKQKTQSNSLHLINSAEIDKLEKSNAKLVIQIKEFTEELNRPLQSTKTASTKISLFSATTREKELENIQKQARIYRKEMLSLRNKIKENCGLTKQAELELALKESLTTTIELKKEIRAMNNLQKDQGRELERIVKHKAFDKRIDSLNDYLNKSKNRAKELESKLQAKGIQNDKVKKQVQLLKGRLQYLHNRIIEEDYREDVMVYEYCTVYSYKDTVMLKANFGFLKATLEKLRIDNNKEIETALISINQLKESVQRASKENTQVTGRLKDLSTIVRMNTTQTHPTKRNVFSVMKQRLKNSIMVHNNNLSVSFIL
eukprot:TRINITY_DN10655_c0_g2_i1.p1 TRINITY_DN10655_c0_g2~~TRINITY_DN10655_c0_g2_i1.p1  ORF type:complete len:315 (-),score=73.99 TRINITY_DN10655_c0_g2_i1:188-1132(-)